MKNKLNLEILNNISDYPLNNDRTLIDYYTKIAEKIEEVTIGTTNKLQKADSALYKKAAAVGSLFAFCVAALFAVKAKAWHNATPDSEPCAFT